LALLSKGWLRKEKNTKQLELGPHHGIPLLKWCGWSQKVQYKKPLSLGLLGRHYIERVPLLWCLILSSSALPKVTCGFHTVCVPWLWWEMLNLEGWWGDPPHPLILHTNQAKPMLNFCFYIWESWVVWLEVWWDLNYTKIYVDSKYETFFFTTSWTLNPNTILLSRLNISMQLMSYIAITKLLFLQNRLLFLRRFIQSCRSLSFYWPCISRQGYCV